MIRRRSTGRLVSSFAAARMASFRVWISLGMVMKVLFPAERPDCRLGSTQLPLERILQLANGPELTGTASSLPDALAMESTKGTRALCAPVKPPDLFCAPLL